MAMFPKLPEEYAGEQKEQQRLVLPSTEARVLKGHEGAVLAVRFNPAGTYCLTCGKDRMVRLWNPHNGVLVKTYAGHGYDVRDAAVATDNSRFVSCGGDKQVFLWDVGTARFIRKFKGHDGIVNAVKFGANDEVLVTAGYDQCLKVWDCKSRSIDAVQTMRDFKDSVTSVAISGWCIFGASVDGTIQRYDIRMGRSYCDQLHHPITSVALSHDGLCVLAACLDSALRLLDRDSGELLASYTGHVHQSVKMDCTLTPSDAHVIGSSESGDIMYWDLVDQSVTSSFKAHSGVVTSLDAHPEGSMLLSASVDGAVKVWT